jgi:NAD(P)-dependent dehydrogenase (short-subunit alcohol dehydrogenase family)
MNSVSSGAGFRNRVVLVTGGSSGIGRAAVHAFAAAGASVMLAARKAERGESVAEEVRGRRGEARFVQAGARGWRTWSAGSL